MSSFFKKISSITILLFTVSIFPYTSQGQPAEPEETISLRRAKTPKIKICSWNIYKLNDSKPANVLQDIARIMRNNECDIISVQEVLSSLPIDTLHGYLNNPGGPGPRWHKLISQSTGESGTQEESYALLWRQDRILYLQAGGLVKYSQMARAPHVARFRALQGGDNGFDFILMSIHAKTGAERNADFHSMRRDFNYIQRLNSSEPDIIMVGDFNLAPSTNPISIWHTHLGDLRWTHTNPPDSSMAGADILNDNIVMGPPTYPDFTNEKNVDPFENSFNNGVTNKRISDHRPIWARFWVNQDHD